ncbi:tRNA pseudouridine(55) synthase TruB [candidate division TA06 bacterium]|uniref:tRNA pseudouridine synthase B n=1 Tax=candidate division TA06 bacterium TaxID=2250710 RepID=A0A933I7Y1_UNCT6|nr:tRNA pseudouridine(55) synthase TruB [candidate division TA06 bacterium]
MNNVPPEDAVYIVNKPPGPTSFAQVASLRRLLGIKKAGHAGTLDPDASGILIVLTGQATRAAKFFEGLDKEYLAGIKLGVTTDTYDLSGQVLSTVAVPDLSRTEIKLALKNFQGQIMQAPPAFSAIKKDGQPLYKAARQGKPVELVPRQIEIQWIKLKQITLPEITVSVKCSKGTYIRSLAFDLGKILGCGAALSGLIRTAVGEFTIDRAVPGDSGKEQLAAAAISIDQALYFIESLELTSDRAQRIGHGNPVDCAHPDAGQVKARYQDQILAIGPVQNHVFKPQTVLAPQC